MTSALPSSTQSLRIVGYFGVGAFGGSATGFAAVEGAAALTVGGACFRANDGAGSLTTLAEAASGGGGGGSVTLEAAGLVISTFVSAGGVAAMYAAVLGPAGAMRENAR